jgi:hypothetical protein
VLLAHDVGVTGVTGEFVDHVDDDPLQRRVLGIVRTFLASCGLLGRPILGYRPFLITRLA